MIKIISGFIVGLIIAYILACYDVDKIILGAVEDTFNKIVTKNQYYMIFGLVGAISGLIGWISWL